MADVLPATNPELEGTSLKDISEAAAADILTAIEETEGGVEGKGSPEVVDEPGVTRSRDHESSEATTTMNDLVPTSTQEIKEDAHGSEGTNAHESAAVIEVGEVDKRGLISPEASEVNEPEPEALVKDDNSNFLESKEVCDMKI